MGLSKFIVPALFGLVGIAVAASVSAAVITNTRTNSVVENTEVNASNPSTETSAKVDSSLIEKNSSETTSEIKDVKNQQTNTKPQMVDKSTQTESEDSTDNSLNEKSEIRKSVEGDNWAWLKPFKVW